MNKFDFIKGRYTQCMIDDTQLSRYLSMGAITQEQYDEIYAIKHPPVEETPTE